ncbi:hypothetical protein FRC11_002677 [Ceratobasidium sp. 423]|nr:hypothetical protein FRC11_002677 [Ceratobasidium sp. 423]
MECNTEDKEFIPGVRDILDAIRQATLSPPNASTSTFNPLVMAMATKLESIDFGLIASQNSEPLDGWSRLSLRLLSVIVDALSEYKLSQTPPPTEDDIAASFVRNLEIMKLSITRPPRWIRNPSNIASAHSSFVFAFEDPNGFIAHRLLNSSLFAFGAHQMLARKPKNQETPHPPGTQEGPRP